MNNLYKVTSKYILACSFVSLLYAFTFQSKNIFQSPNSFHNNLTAPSDTTKPHKKKSSRAQINQIPKTDTAIAGKNNNDTSILKQKNDTLDIKISKDSLDAPVEYNAEDSMIMDVPSKKITLYGKKSATHYKDNDLSAPEIEFDQVTGNITASIKRDSTGKVIAMPTYKQADFVSQSDSIKFNMKSGRGITKSTYTQQGEMYVYGETFKKESDNIIYVKRGRMTTCNLDTPHFAFISAKIKIVNKKLAITGPVHPEFEGVPIPIYLPFGIYPLSQGRHSGILAPTFTSNQQLGLGLEGLGYYQTIGDYWDVTTRANIYSYGGWTLDLNPRYTKRYHYTGNLSFGIQSFKYNFKGDPDYSENKSYHLSWAHSVDSKARPGVGFSANVNISSSSYNSLVPNNPTQNFSNQLTSSITYSKTGTLEAFGDDWRDKTYNLTISANHNQNTELKLFNVNLPDIAFNVSTIYPFKSKEVIGTPKWYENIGLSYTGDVKSLFSFYDTVPHIFQRIKDTFQWGAHHTIPISLSLPQVGAFQFSPSINYDQTWYQRKFIRSWDDPLKKVDTTITRGFYTAQQMSFGMSISTKIIGLFTPKNKDAEIQAIRHEIRPSISFSYQPDLNKGNYYTTQVDTFKNKLQFSQFEGNINSAYGAGSFGGISFIIDNNIQAKVRNKKDTGDNPIKKITLLDEFSISGSYNFLADSFQLSDFNINAHTSIFNNKANITGGATLDPYDVDARGQRLKTLLWDRKPLSFGRLINGNISVSSQFQGGKSSKVNSYQNNLLTNNYAANNGYTPDEYQTELAYIRNNPGEYADFNIPWSVNFSYALTFGRILNPDYSGYTTQFTQNVTFGGTLNLTPKWQIAISGASYNISLGQLGTFPISISREMHCWQMSITVSPIGIYKFYSINLSPKSGLLRDLKINRTRSTYDGF